MKVSPFIRFSPICLAIAAILLLTSCNTGSKPGTTTTASAATTTAITGAIDRNKKPLGFQFDPPAKGEQIAVMVTSMGTMRFRLFADAAPNAVKNFKELIKKDYYKNMIFHRVMKEFMIQSGDPKGDGTGGTAASGTPFKIETNTNLLNFTGALGMANSGYDQNTSQFYIVTVTAPNSVKDSAGSPYYSIKNKLDAAIYKKMSQKAIDLYNQHGGYPSLDGAWSDAGAGYTVFGQIFAADLPVAMKISQVDTKAVFGTTAKGQTTSSGEAVTSIANDRPVTPVKLISITLETYEG